jgi:hypothetical protein
LKSYPFFEWDDQEYSSFMIRLLLFLEPKVFRPKEMIIESLQSNDEMFFVENGIYDVGFEWNNNKLYRLQFGQRTVIGGFNLCFN